MGGVAGETVSDGDADVVELVTSALVIVDVVGGDVAEAEVPGEGDEGADALGVAVNEVVLELDVEVVVAKEAGIGKGGLASLREAALGGERGDLASLAA